MRVVVCVRRGLDGELGPFDSAAYEAALRIENAEVILLSMGTPETAELLKRLTRLGAKSAVLLSDKAFAGADTLATAYALSLAIKRLKPDLVFCGRQTTVGDTAQTGVMLSSLAGLDIITNAMSVESVDVEKIVCETRDEGVCEARLPALVTLERIYTLRLPRLRSREGCVEVWSAEDIGADIERCGLHGSPTRVVETHENESGKRKCRFISPDGFMSAIKEGLEKKQISSSRSVSDKRLSRVCIVGDSPLEYAESVSDDIIRIELTSAEDIAEKISQIKPNAVLWGSDSRSKRVASQTAVLLDVGLCADCTSLETDGSELFMVRPALSGTTIAKIRSTRYPAMATVRTSTDTSDVVLGIGYGARDSVEELKALAEKIGADVSASRMCVDHGIMEYEKQVGLTGKTVAPSVYIAVGISGAVHHIAGMKYSGTVIAVNPDKNAPIFDYADYGILASADELLKK
ncbi:MAG: FAD-binding protein [Clostridia bacterium]|nr:FAD-binding protein [Clostridia bacterium]